MGRQQSEYAPFPGLFIIPPVIENQQIQPPEDGQQVQGVVGQLPEILLQQPAPVLRQDGHRRADAAGLLHSGNPGVAVFLKGGVPLLAGKLVQDLPVNGDIAGGGGAHGCRGRVGVGQLLPHLPQVLHSGQAEEHQQQRGKYFCLKPQLPGPPGQGHVRPLLVLPENKVHQKQPRAHTHANGVAYNGLPVLLQSLFCVVQLVVLVRPILPVVALDEDLGTADDRHGHLDVASYLVHREILVAGDVPLVKILLLVEVVVAAAVDVLLLPVQPDAHLLPVEDQEKAVALGHQGGGVHVRTEGVRVAVGSLPLPLRPAPSQRLLLLPVHPVEDVFILLVVLVESLNPVAVDAVVVGPARVVVILGVIHMAPRPHGDQILQPGGDEVLKLPGSAPVAFEAVIEPGAAVGGGENRAEVQRPLQHQGDPQQKGQKSND